ncbi:Hypothetical_protein [Hexamita inflata]|uniref:Hypothetical_protein n=1 Tax=Hexamita inflata TaxID=28002 RepID=A0AA86NY97_9EUKA|nr:Hypothetical protein HINF_LOCUS15188 [Hexamita inflata]
MNQFETAQKHSPLIWLDLAGQTQIPLTFQALTAHQHLFPTTTAFLVAQTHSPLLSTDQAGQMHLLLSLTAFIPQTQAPPTTNAFSVQHTHTRLSRIEPAGHQHFPFVNVAFTGHLHSPASKNAFSMLQEHSLLDARVPFGHVHSPLIKLAEGMQGQKVDGQLEGMLIELEQFTKFMLKVCTDPDDLYTKPQAQDVADNYKEKLMLEKLAEALFSKIRPYALPPDREPEITKLQNNELPVTSRRRPQEVVALTQNANEVFKTLITSAYAEIPQKQVTCFKLQIITDQFIVIGYQNDFATPLKLFIESIDEIFIELQQIIIGNSISVQTSKLTLLQPVLTSFILSQLSNILHCQNTQKNSEKSCQFTLISPLMRNQTILQLA